LKYGRDDISVVVAFLEFEAVDPDPDK